jgi:hypothetical protein
MDNKSTMGDSSLRTIDKIRTGTLLNDYNVHFWRLSEVTQYDASKLLLTTKVVTKKECENIISNVSKYYMPEKLTSYPSNIRDAHRSCIIDEKFADLLWFRLNKIITKYEIKPYGLHKHNNWIPVKINPCMRISKYDTGSIGFKYHYDNQFLESDTIRSGLSVIIYLNDYTNFYTTSFFDTNKISLSGLTVEEEIKSNGGIDDYTRFDIKPLIGQCVIFEHNLLHCGLPVMTGIKWIIRTDVVYESTDNIPQYPTVISEDKYKNTLYHFRNAQQAELKGDVIQASELYERSLSMRIHTVYNVFDVWNIVMAYMNLHELMIISKVCKQLNINIKNRRSQYWKLVKHKMSNIEPEKKRIRTNGRQNPKKKLKRSQIIKRQYIPTCKKINGPETVFKFHHNDFFNSNLEGCLRVAAMYTIYMFSNKPMKSCSYIASYDYKTGDAIKCPLEYLLIGAFHEISVFGTMFNVYNDNQFDITNKPVLREYKHYKSQWCCFVYNDIEELVPASIDRDYINNNKENFLKLEDKLDISDYKKYISSVQHKIGYTEIIRHKYTKWEHDSENKQQTRTYNNLIFDFSTHKIQIKKCDGCDLCKDKEGYVVSIADIKMKSFFHAADICSPEPSRTKRKLLEYGNTFNFKHNRYINSIHITILRKKKIYVQTVYDAIESF